MGIQRTELFGKIGSQETVLEGLLSEQSERRNRGRDTAEYSRMHHESGRKDEVKVVV